jgi:hypothetical protein
MGVHNSPVSNDDLHPDIVLLSGDVPVYQLKVMAKADQMGLSSGMQQESVVVPLSVPDAMAAEIKGNTGHNNKVRFIRMKINAGRAWLQNAETPFRQRMHCFNLSEHHPFSAHSRIQDTLSRRKSGFKYVRGVGFIMDRGIQSDTTSPHKPLKRNQLPLRHPAGREPLLMAERPAPGKNLLAE